MLPANAGRVARGGTARLSWLLLYLACPAVNVCDREGEVTARFESLEAYVEGAG